MNPNIKCSYTKLVNLEELKPHPGNENEHPERQIEALAKIIAKLGQRSPIVVSKRSGFITKGHGRLEAIKKLGWESAAVDFQEYESELEEFNDRVADNEIARYAEFNFGKFELNLKAMNLDLKSVDLPTFGLLDINFEKIEPKNTAGEVDLNKFSNFQHSCPKCGFEWNDDGQDNASGT
jgi:hypothetical protein